MKKKLHYTFHNPNTDEATFAALLPILIEANKKKVEKAIQEAIRESQISEEKRTSV